MCFELYFQNHPFEAQTLRFQCLYHPFSFFTTATLVIHDLYNLKISLMHDVFEQMFKTVGNISIVNAINIFRIFSNSFGFACHPMNQPKHKIRAHCKSALLPSQLTNSNYFWNSLHFTDITVHCFKIQTFFGIVVG